MAWNYGVVYNPAALTLSGIQGRFTEISDIIIGINSDWSLTQNTIYNTNSCGMILTHADGAQIAFVVQLSDALDASNSYGGDTTNLDILWLAFNPSSNGTTWATINDSVNPTDTSTWCSDAGSYLFQRMYTSNTSTIFGTFGWVMRVMADSTSANLTLITSNLTASDYLIYMAMFVDDATDTSNFSTMYNTGDAEKSFFMTTRLHVDETISDKTPGNDVLQVQYKLANGTIVESGEFEVPYDKFTWIFSDLESTSDSERLERIKVIRESNDIKGYLDPRILLSAREDLLPNVIIKNVDDEYWLHIANGILIPWESNLKTFK